VFISRKARIGAPGALYPIIIRGKHRRQDFLFEMKFEIPSIQGHKKTANDIEGEG
jgi:hypothetical protein